MNYFDNGPLIQNVSATPQFNNPQQPNLMPYLVGGLFLALTIVGYLYYQNQRLKKQMGN